VVCPFTVTVTDLRNSDGQVVALVFNRADGFPLKANRAALVVAGTIQGRVGTVNVGSLPCGGYAVALFHDENGNLKLDTHWFGPPREGLAASNDAKGSFGPPKYKDARFQLTAPGQAIRARMAYPF